MESHNSITLTGRRIVRQLGRKSILIPKIIANCHPRGGTKLWIRTGETRGKIPCVFKKKVGRGGGDRTQYPTRQVIESIHPRTQIWGHLGPKGSPPSPLPYVANRR